MQWWKRSETDGIVKLGVMAAPSLMIDGKLVIAGRTAKTSEIVRLLKK